MTFIKYVRAFFLFIKDIVTDAAIVSTWKAIVASFKARFLDLK